MRYPEPLLLLLSLLVLPDGSLAADADAVSEEVPTTVPIFLPYYSTKSWSLVRGSIITSVCILQDPVAAL